MPYKECLVDLLDLCVQPEVQIVDVEINERSSWSGKPHLLKDLLAQSLSDQSWIGKAVVETELPEPAESLGEVEEIEIDLETQSSRAASRSKHQRGVPFGTNRNVWVSPAIKLEIRSFIFCGARIGHNPLPTILVHHDTNSHYPVFDERLRCLA